MVYPFCSHCIDDTVEISVVLGLNTCRECAMELLFGIIDTTPARLFSPGGGCPLEPNEDDATPWQENAIRIMEDG